MEIKVFPCGSLQTNCYLVWDPTSKIGFIVDPGDVSKDLKNFIDKEGITPDYIILTHGHGDHTGGISDLRKTYTDIKLIASRKEKKFLFDRKASYGEGGIECDIYVDDKEEMMIGDQKLKFISTPGHTPGGMCILMNKILFSGDTLFRSSIGRTDFPGGNFEDIVCSIKSKLFVLPEDTKVLPGHEEQTTIGYEARFNPFV